MRNKMKDFATFGFSKASPVMAYEAALLMEKFIRKMSPEDFANFLANPSDKATLDSFRDFYIDKQRSLNAEKDASSQDISQSSAVIKGKPL